MDDAEALPALFSECRFAIVCGGDLPLDAAKKLARTLRLHGGEIAVDSFDGEQLPVEDLTHIVCVSCDFPSYHAASDALLPVIKPEWVDASLAKSKLANPRQYSADPRMFMSGVVICCADLPEGDQDAIVGGVLAMGGLHSPKVSSMVTHIVALTMDSEICRQVAIRRLNIKMVLPHWFDDCLKLGRRIDENPYLLPDPEILRAQASIPPKAIGSMSLGGAVNPDPSQTSPPAPHPSPRGSLRVFASKNVMLSHDLGIGSHLKDVLTSLIKESDGQLVTNVKKADMYICKYREGADYLTASLAWKDVGNLGWLYYLITNNSWTSPMRRLLHYPVARNGVPGFPGLRISLSNYSGEARLYLENLVIAAGAECTKTLKQDNTHLITAYNVSEKCAAASEWGVHIVNHLWLEESYAKWKMQSIANSRYTHFPRRTNLGEVVGQTDVDRRPLEVHFFHDSKLEHGNVEDPAKAVHRRGANENPHLDLNDPRETPKRTNQANGMAGSIQKQTPAARRLVIDGKENQTPNTGSSRKSKEAAVARLHDQASDISLYEKEKKRVGGVVYGGRRKHDVDRVSVSRKRSMTADSDSEGTEEGERKRMRSETPVPTMHLLVSGYDTWVKRPSTEAEDTNRLRRLGVVLTADASRATHLAAPRILRTLKFVSAMAYGPVIVSTDFIENCLQQDRLLDPKDYPLKDEATEKRFNFSLLEAHERAKANPNQLFQGWTIYCVEDIRGGFDTFKHIIEANGGRCNKYRGRPGTTVSSRNQNNEAHSRDQNPREDVILISERSQNRLWPRFRQMAQTSGAIPKIVESDWVLNSALSQQVLPVEPHELC